MIEKICIYLMNRIRKRTPDMDDEQAEVVKFGLELVVGEIPKIFLMIAIAFLLGIGPLTILAFILITPYRSASGGFHLKTHLGCIIATVTFYCGNVLISKNIVFEPLYVKYIVIAFVWIFGMIMCKLYAPADTESVPILSTKERIKKRRMSYITLTISLIVAAIVPNSTIANILIIGMLFQSISITKIAYRLTKSQYGYEVYGMPSQS